MLLYATEYDILSLFSEITWKREKKLRMCALFLMKMSWFRWRNIVYMSTNIYVIDVSKISIKIVCVYVRMFKSICQSEEKPTHRH